MEYKYRDKDKRNGEYERNGEDKCNDKVNGMSNEK
jgi:hypothetical protein